MTSMLRSLPGRVLLIPLFATLVLAALADSSCDDFLAKLHKKPNNLQFLGCKQRTELQGRPWEASYRVTGGHAAEVERSLVKELGIKRLRRTCCVWESMDNSYRDKHAQFFVISVSTDETTIDSRDHWVEIPYFYVTVYRYGEAP